MYHSFKTLLFGLAGLLAFHHRALAQSNPTVTDYLFPVSECIEPPQDLTNTPLDGFTDAILRVPRAYFSTYSSESTVKNIPVGLLFGNFFSPGNQSDGQTTNFIPGYDRGAFGVSLYAVKGTDYWNVTGTPAYAWFLNGSLVSVSPSTHAAWSSYATTDTSQPIQAVYGFAYCPATLIPAIPVLFRGTTALNQKIATLLTPVPPGVAISVQAVPYVLVVDFNSNPSTPYFLESPSDVTLQNVRYSGGAIYADITTGAGSAVTPSKIALRVKAQNTVIAFGSVPVLETIGCSASLTGSVPGGSVGSPYSATLSVVPAGTYTMTMSGALPSGLSFSNGAISGTPMDAGTYGFSVAASGSQGCSVTQNYSLSIAGAGCSSDVTSQVAITFSGLTRNLATGQWNETVTLQNMGSAPLTGPVALVLSTLSSNATLVDGQGFTSCSAPSGQPYVTIPGGLNAGQSAAVTLTFTNSQASQGITFTPRVLAGGSAF
jgi:hypothetical protein